MKSFLDYYNNLISAGSDAFWGGIQFRVFFLLAVLSIVLLEKNKSNKIGLIGYNLVILLALHLPFIAYLCVKVFGYSIPYYARLFSLLPVVLIIAYGTTLLMSNLQKAKKLISVVLMIILLIVGGSYLYDHGWPYSSSNSEKIPSDVIQIADFVDPNRDTIVTVAVPNNLTAYLRQIDANIVMPYGRESSSNLSACLSAAEIGDAMDILLQAGNCGCDYVVVIRSDVNYSAFISVGLSPIENSDNYYIYPVTNCIRNHREYNKSMQLCSLTYLNADDMPYISDKGYCTIQFTRDSANHVISEYYFDDKNNPISLGYGQYGCLWEYDTQGNIIRFTYIDSLGNPLTCSFGYAIIESTFDSKNQRTLDRYLDANSNPIAKVNGPHGYSYEYDTCGNLTRKTFLDEQLNPIILSNYGYASISYEYNNASQKVAEKYYDERNNPLALSSGQYGCIYEYDSNGIITQQVYIDIEGKPIIPK